MILRGPVLIADTDPEALAALAELLESDGYDVLEASTGKSALETARALRPVLAILEVPLGDRSGYEVCRALRKELGETLPVLFLSGCRTEPYDRVAGLLVGADDYVVKPYAPDELLARVRRLVTQPRRAVAPLETDLTRRELEVLELLTEGLGVADIARRLFITKKTVGTHIEHIFLKLRVSSRGQAVAVAYRDHLVAIPQ